MQMSKQAPHLIGIALATLLALAAAISAVVSPPRLDAPAAQKIGDRL